MEGWRKRQKDMNEERNPSAVRDPQDIYSFVDELDFNIHLDKKHMLKPERSKKNKKHLESDSNASTPFLNPANEMTHVASASNESNSNRKRSNTSKNKKGFKIRINSKSSSQKAKNKSSESNDQSDEKIKEQKANKKKKKSNAQSKKKSTDSEKKSLFSQRKKKEKKQFHDHFKSISIFPKKKEKNSPQKIQLHSSDEKKSKKQKEKTMDSSSVVLPKEKKAIKKKNHERKPLFTSKDSKTFEKNKVDDGENDQQQPFHTKTAENIISLLKTEALKQISLTEDEQKQWKEIEFYELQAPFAFVSIVQNNVTKDRRYLVLEQQLNPKEKQHYTFIIDALETYSLDISEIEGEGSVPVLYREITEIISDYGLHITDESKNKITYFLQKQLLGFGKIDSLMKDQNIEDISCDGSEVHIFLYHRNHGSIQSNILFDDEEELSNFVMRLAQKSGKHISIAHPMLDATMPDGSRIQMTLSTEVSTKGSTFTIRKFREQPFSPADLIKFNSMSSEMIAYFWLAVEHGINGLIAGGTAAGKTSTLNALALFIPRESKIVSIEETREINLPHPNWIPGVSRSGFGDVVAGKMTGEIDLYDLMKAALRQRPEYILVGEIRGREAYVLFQAMATGHTTYSTVHADSTKSLIHRLEGEPINIPRIMLQSLDVVCLQTIARVKNKRARRVKQVIEIIDIDPTTKEILTNEVFRWDPIEDMFMYSGKSYILEQIRNETNQTREEITQELKQRAKILDWMVDHDIHIFDDVASLTAQYYEHPDQVIKKISGDS